MANSKRKAHCNKKPFTSLLAAQVGARKTQGQTKKSGDPIVTGLAAYKCPYCPAYHIGRSQKKGINWALVAARDAQLKNLPAWRSASISAWEETSFLLSRRL